MLANLAQPTQRVALVIQYLGTHFCGWQWQPRQRTVQEELEKALASVLGRSVRVHGAGRTDSGVHAAAQVAHFDAPVEVPAHRWASILNARLPADVLIRASALVEADWHARFSAIWRRYRYLLYTDPCPNIFVGSIAWHYYQNALDEELMQKALIPLLGRHHLAAFQRAGTSRPHAWVDVQAVECLRRDAFVAIEIQASGFLYGMMRLLVGLLVQVGRGDCSPEQFTEIWTSQSREAVKHSAPARGLCLLRVGYPNFPIAPEIWFDAQPTLSFPGLSGG